MSNTHEKRTAIVTGASSGIGFAIARAYLDRGYNVVGNSSNEARLTEAARTLAAPDRFIGVAGDIGRKKTAETLFETAIGAFGAVDILVNNAGIFQVKAFQDVTESEIDALISTNLKGFLYPSQLAAAHMAGRGKGHIISITANIAMQPIHGVPATVPILIKGGINQAVKALAIELAPHNVLVTAVAPGLIDTPLHKPETHGFLNGLVPLGHIGTPEDIAAAVLHLGDARHTTGIVLSVDGGLGAGR